MKKITGIIAAVFAGAMLFSCANGLDGGTEGNSKAAREAGTYKTDETLAPVADGYLRINTLLTDAKDLWIWNDFDPSATALCKNWSEMAFPIKEKNGDFVYADIKLQDAPQQVSFILRKEFNDNGKLTGDITFLFPSKYNEIFLKDGSGTIYIDSACTKEPTGLASAMITGEHAISATVKGISLSAENTKVFKADGTTEIKIDSISGSTITVSESLKENGTVYVQYSDENGADKRVANFDSKLIDEWFNVDDSEIANFGYKDGVFTTWAPLSSSAKVLLFESADTVSGDSYKVAAEIPMERQTNGTWKTKNVSSDVGANKYYKYSFMTNGVQYDVCDIWAKSASKDSVASAIAGVPANPESSYTNPFGKNGSDTKLYNDAIIYEMHITDWSQAFRSSVEKDKPGTFKEITDALGTNGNGKFGKHLRDLDVTHVQILPMFEYAVTTKGSSSTDSDGKETVSFTENDNAYNWGYNPYNWNTPESRYVKDMTDGSDAISQMQEMIKAFHDAGIAVIMDVVYNHTAGTGKGSIYDMTVPKYFYRMDSQGNYSNGSGCGNETASEHAMVRKYMIDSLKHWMNDYHINGFRFDLMGLHDKETMKEIYDELYKIDKNVLVYGEPWTGDGSKKDDRAICAGASSSGYGYGAFDDDFRDAIKGGEYGGFQIGQVQSANSDSGIIKGLLGEAGKNNRNTTGIPGLALHYAECHDNYTLFDKLVYSTIAPLSGDFADKFADAYKVVIADKDKLNAIKAQNKLAAAYVLLSQGTPFINGGQEFMRTKQGDPDSYAADKKGGVFWSNIDEVNAIDLTMKDEYSDVYNVYKGLIALRKSSKAFTEGTASAKTLAKGVTVYNVKSDSEEFEVYFNASDKAYVISGANLSGNLGLGMNDVQIELGAKGKPVDVLEGKADIAETETVLTTVPAKSFKILMK